MNYLAHCALAGADEDLVVGALLGDFLKGPVPELPGRVGLGVRLHRQIDAFTARQEDIRRSVLRFGPALRRTAPIFVDLAADHFLAIDFERYHEVPVDSFSRQVYQTLHLRRTLLPEPARRLLEYMTRTDLLAAYRERDVLARAYVRIGERLALPGIAPQAMERLVRDYDAFRADFADYYPALQRHAAEWVHARVRERMQGT
jgi:acyl carrier protein phosphodiesterase